jgi:hypothetical protein
MEDDCLIKCSLCNDLVRLFDVQDHKCNSKKKRNSQKKKDFFFEEYADVEEAMKGAFSAETGLVIEESEETEHVLVKDNFQLFKVSDPAGEHVGWVSKSGADFSLYGKGSLLLKKVTGRLMEKKEALVSDFEEEDSLALLCKVCLLKVPIDLVESHAKTCAISFPVQIIRFEHSAEAEVETKKKKKKEDESVIAVLEDFPQSVLNALDKSAVPREMYSKHLDVLVNVLNFASKMKFTLASNRPSLARTVAGDILKSDNFDAASISELCKIVQGQASNAKNVALAQTVGSTLKEGLAVIYGMQVMPSPVVKPARNENQRIIAAQKVVMQEASKLYEETTTRKVKKLYAMQKKIGEGGYGKVYVAKCKDKNLKPSLVAIKVMEHNSGDAKSKRTNLRELLYLSRLKHKNIVQMYRSYLVDNSSLWLVLEYMEGGTLREASKACIFDEDEIAFCGYEILLAVAFMHEHGCVHRDIKSHNVMMTGKGYVLLFL